MSPNTTLTKWCAEQGFEIDRLWNETADTFVARLETLVADPAHAPRAARPPVRLDFKLAVRQGR